MNLYRAYVYAVEERVVQVKANNEKEARDKAWELLKDEVFKDSENYDIGVRAEKIKGNIE